jgi:hypothetical protein
MKRGKGLPWIESIRLTSNLQNKEKRKGKKDK